MLSGSATPDDSIWRLELHAHRVGIFDERATRASARGGRPAPLLLAETILKRSHLRAHRRVLTVGARELLAQLADRHLERGHLLLRRGSRRRCRVCRLLSWSSPVVVAVAVVNSLSVVPLPFGCSGVLSAS